MRLVALSLLVCLSSTASAQSITSFAPDTTKQESSAPPDQVDIPLWFGLQVAPIAGQSSRFEDRELDPESASVPWIGASATWPWVGPQQGWLDIGYQHWKFRGEFGTEAGPGGLVTFYRLLPFSLDRFGIRSGVDQLLWRDHAVSAAIGAGVGAGFGYAQVSLIDEADVLWNYELIAHAVVFFRVRSNTRIGVGASGVLSGEFASGESHGPWQHLELVLRLDQMLRLPKRIIPGP